MQDMSNTLSGDELSSIRDAVPALDLLAIRSLRRAGFKIVRDTGAVSSQEHSQDCAQDRGWGSKKHTISSAA